MFAPLTGWRWKSCPNTEGNITDNTATAGATKSSTSGTVVGFNKTEAAAYRAITAQNWVYGNVLGWFGISSRYLNLFGLGVRVLGINAGFCVRLCR